PGATIPDATITPNTAPASEADNPAARNQRQVLAQQLQLDLSEVDITEVEAVTWGDQCLGVPNPVELCAAAETPGYRITLTANGDTYVYHTNEDGSLVRLADVPEAQIGATVIEWTGSDDSGCNSALFGPDGVAIGRCYAQLLTVPFGMPSRRADLADFAATFAPFTADTAAGAVTFNGAGSTAATPAQQRMIAEWARLAQLEAQGGRSGASWGLALAWHREGGIAGFCDDLTVYVTDEAWATTCRGATPQDLGHFRLDAEQLATLYEWVDTFASFEYNQSDPAAADSMTVKLIFSGAGAQRATADEQAAIVDFAQTLYGAATTAAGDALGETPATCASPATDQRLLVQAEQGYCLLYPATHTVTETAPGSTAIVVDSIMNHVDPRVAVVVEAANGRTVDEVAAAALADYSLPADMNNPQPATVGGEPAVMLDNLPGQDLNRRLFVIHDEQLYSFFFAPIGDAETAVRIQAEALYNTVVDSFHFVATSAADAETPVSAAPESDTGEAAVEAVDMRILESFPVQVQAVVSGQLPDACAFVESSEVTVAANAFYVSMTVARQPNMRCAQVLTPFEQVIPLETAELPAGDYSVQAGNVKTVFTLP
ncbi:MAG: hypothetical protein KDD75_23635, partial [Caldilineaceae bacterium]|nr:hypothetical protein [Caldilineaceae bacterium]